jgi:hypothetical protein
MKLRSSAVGWNDCSRRQSPWRLMDFIAAAKAFLATDSIHIFADSLLAKDEIITFMPAESSHGVDFCFHPPREFLIGQS